MVVAPVFFVDIVVLSSVIVAIMLLVVAVAYRDIIVVSSIFSCHFRVVNNSRYTTVIKVR